MFLHVKSTKIVLFQCCYKNWLTALFVFISLVIYFCISKVFIVNLLSGCVYF